MEKRRRRHRAFVASFRQNRAGTDYYGPASFVAYRRGHRQSQRLPRRSRDANFGRALSHINISCSIANSRRTWFITYLLKFVTAGGGVFFTAGTGAFAGG